MLAVGGVTERVIAIAQSRECRGQGDGKDRSQLDTEAGWWQLPKAQAGYRDCGSDGNSSGRSPRSPRTNDHASSWTDGADRFRTTVLRLDAVSREDTFVGLGGDSLYATQAASQIRKEFGVRLSPASILDGRSLAELAQLLESDVSSAAT